MTGLLAPNTFLQARYVITRKLGQGGMGAVYQAQDARLQGKLWAIKEMSDAQLADPAERANAVAAFRREAQLLATLDHTNLPKVADFFEEGGKQYLVMDFVEGQTLEQIVATTPGFLPEPTVLAWIEQLCDVLEYLHTRQPPIVFRDLKPANIMLMREGKIKLIDFGIARFFKAGKTKDTAQYGTMGYAAPEQFGTGQTDARSDIYSLGVTLHYLLTKFDPALTPFNLPPVRNINPLISAQTDAVIVRATRSASVERFQTAGEMKQALRGMSRAGVQATAPTVPPASPISSHTPYVFAPGKVANTMQDLVRFCEQDWERAVNQFYDGHFEQWLKSVGEFGLASEAKRITDRRMADPAERSIGLREWLKQTGLSRLHLLNPILEVSPLVLDFGKIRQVQILQLHIRNRGGQDLRGSLSTERIWIEIVPESFDGNNVSIAVKIDPVTLPPTRSKIKGEIEISSNGGTQTVQVCVEP
jgi:serine/threonine protein kinase